MSEKCSKLLILFVTLQSLLTIVKLNVLDISTQSNFDEVIATHLDLNLKIDFDKKTFEGIAQYTFKATSNNVSKLVLDTDALVIVYVTDLNNKVLVWHLDKKNESETLGLPLIIILKKPLRVGETVSIRIYYQTSQQQTSLGLQWLSPKMTADKKYPFVYTHAEAIHARSFYPCMDTPYVKFTVKASLIVLKPFVALFGGVKIEEIVNGDLITYVYEQRIPIPSYLVAIAVGGELQYRDLGKTTTTDIGVWAEKSVIQTAENVFSDTKELLETAISYLTEYEWKVYNILVLPPGFPMGGMENPCLTFATPSILATDKSLVNVIAHEISHSWTGNLVTNKNWQNFWLNEGFTMFNERKIAELQDKNTDMSNLDAVVGYKDLKNDVIKYGPTSNYTSLFPLLGSADPDDAFSTVPYEKGYTFCRYLETLVGKTIYQQILKQYITTYRLQSVDYLQWKNMYETQVKKLIPDKADQILSQIDWQTWIFSPGLPNTTLINYNSTLIDEVKNNVDYIFFNKKLPEHFKITFDTWKTNSKLYFINQLLDNVPTLGDNIYQLLTTELGINQKSGYNMEVLNLWYQLSLITKHTDLLLDIDDFLSKTGRMKYIRPIYVAYAALDRDKATKKFYSLRELYSPIAVTQIEKDLKLAGEEVLVNIVQMNKVYRHKRY